ncbi:MAG: sulfite exporter TauE/SafE family protein [Deltaproteobacteria bacterium]|nr:sulfite exporter TauE/SafE family protein [Deltaproteobacteria bacterium]
MIPGNMPIEFTAACFTALLLGITSGISQCTVVCAPFISTYVMGTRKGAAEGLKSFFVFSAGRVFMCSMLGLGAGYMGAAFTGMERNFKYGSIIYGAALILTGSLMLMRPICVCRKSEDKKRLFAFLSRRFAFNPTTHLFVMGSALATIPCPPMGAMLLYSLNMQSIISCGIMMALFGIGTVVSPLAFISVAAGWFSGKIKTGAPQYRMIFQRISGSILILLGGFSAIT